MRAANLPESTQTEQIKGGVYHGRWGDGLSLCLDLCPAAGRGNVKKTAASKAAHNAFHNKGNRVPVGDTLKPVLLQRQRQATLAAKNRN
jgi:hypothetical protein